MGTADTSKETTRVSPVLGTSDLQIITVKKVDDTFSLKIFRGRKRKKKEGGSGG